MRFCIKFSCEKLPISYHIMFVSLIKKALEVSDEEYFKSLYDFNGKKNKKIKDFTFSIKLSAFKLQNDEFILKDGFSFYFSTPNDHTASNFYNGILEIKTFKYNKYEAVRLRTDLVREKKIDSNEVIFKTLSSLIIKDKNKKVLSLDDENFEHELNYIANNILHATRGVGLKEKLIFENINLKKVVVKEEIAEFTKQTNKKYYTINALRGLFKLKGNKEDLNILYKTGVSFRRAMGFGMLDVWEV